MERLLNVWNELNDWVYANWDDPLFQMLQGIVLGLVIAGAVWMMSKAFEKDEFDEPTLAQYDGISDSTEGNRDESI